MILLTLDEDTPLQGYTNPHTLHIYNAQDKKNPLNLTLWYQIALVGPSLQN